MAPLKGQNKSRKRQISLREAANNASKKRQKKSQWSIKRRNQGWIDIDPNKNKWELKNLPPVTTGARIAGIGRTATISDVFLTLLPPSILVKVRGEIGKEQFGFGNNKITMVEIYKMIAATIFLSAAAPTIDKGTVHNLFNEVYKIACNFVENKGCLGI